ncbi:hypothetical protein HPP92_005961 [Vanilla planifolia]|uniref:K-box domain-containing protein n=1 Tax=Vanilla planifolia TaxID=51239 RepID=A0A835VCQ9_VANPL|nr:hypothetical protein HPP92_005961 [Vanilla planifolia]
MGNGMQNSGKQEKLWKHGKNFGSFPGFLCRWRSPKREEERQRDGDAISDVVEEMGCKRSLIVVLCNDELENGSFAALSIQMADASRQIRHMRGEDLQGLTIQELQQLEKTLEVGLSHVIRKDEQILEQINDIRNKEMQLLKENAWLRHQLADISSIRKQAAVEAEIAFQEDGQSSLSETNLTHSGSRENDDFSDTSLRLGNSDNFFVPAFASCRFSFPSRK